MTIYKIGQRVKTLIGNIDGVITACCIRGESYALYELSYITEGEHKTTWMTSFEFYESELSVEKIGFYK